MIPVILRLAAQLAQAGKDDLLQELLKQLSSAAEETVFFKEHLCQILDAMVQLATATSEVSEAARKLALEVLLSCIQGKAKLCANAPGFVLQTMDVCARFILELSDDVESWTKEDEDEAEDEDVPSVGMQ